MNAKNILTTSPSAKTRVSVASGEKLPTHSFTAIEVGKAIPFGIGFSSSLSSPRSAIKDKLWFIPTITSRWVALYKATRRRIDQDCTRTESFL